jgi:hypothetical protein
VAKLKEEVQLLHVGTAKRSRPDLLLALLDHANLGTNSTGALTTTVNSSAKLSGRPLINDFVETKLMSSQK